MRWRVHYMPEATSIIRNLAPEVKATVRRAIHELADNPFVGKELQGDLAGFRSHRVRRYRIVYLVNESESSLDVYYVGPRRDVNKAFAELLREDSGL